MNECSDYDFIARKFKNWPKPQLRYHKLPEEELEYWIPWSGLI